MRVMPLTSQNCLTLFVIVCGKIRFSPSMPACIRGQDQILPKNACMHQEPYSNAAHARQCPAQTPDSVEEKMRYEKRAGVICAQYLCQLSTSKHLMWSNTDAWEVHDIMPQRAALTKQIGKGQGKQENVRGCGGSYFQPSPRWPLQRCQLSTRSLA